MTEKEPWVSFLEYGVIGKTVQGQGFVYQVSLKVDATGVFAVIKVKGDEGRKVAFVSAKGLESVSREIRSALSGGEARWRDDKF